MQMFFKLEVREKASVATQTSISQTGAQHGILYLHETTLSKQINCEAKGI
jgi:hypothetical protein